MMALKIVKFQAECCQLKPLSKVPHICLVTHALSDRVFLYQRNRARWRQPGFITLRIGLPCKTQNHTHWLTIYSDLDTIYLKNYNYTFH